MEHAALLIGILLPAMMQARGQARRVRIAATVSALAHGLEMFRADFGEYPNSRRRIEPIIDLPGSGGLGALEGVHILARALVGHDRQGIDYGGKALKILSAADSKDVTMAELAPPRRGPYVDKVVVVADNDPVVFGANLEPSRLGKLVIVDDAYQFPFLYYRASPRASDPFSVYGFGSADPGGYPDRRGVYNLMDNQSVTGRWDGPNKESSVLGWDLAHSGIRPHPMAAFGSTDPAQVNAASAFYRRGKTFIGKLHNPHLLQSGGTVRPVNPDTYILLNPGEDGLYGTEDDVGNF